VKPWFYCLNKALKKLEIEGVRGFSLIVKADNM
jgi:hypothetical protein